MLLGPLDNWGVGNPERSFILGNVLVVGVKIRARSPELRLRTPENPLFPGGLPTIGRRSSSGPGRSPVRLAGGSWKGEGARDGSAECKFSLRMGPRKGLVDGVW